MAYRRRGGDTPVAAGCHARDRQRRRGYRHGLPVQDRARDGRKAPESSAQLLATVRGAVYVSDRGRLTPLANALVEVVGGPSLGKRTTTGADGTYELPAVVPGDIVIRATRSGFEPAVLSARIQPGDNRISMVVTAEPTIKVLA